MDAKGCPHTVALSPAGAVQYHCRKEKQGGEAKKGRSLVAGETFRQPKTTPGQQNIEEDGEKFDAVKVGKREIGQKSQ